MFQGALPGHHSDRESRKPRALCRHPAPDHGASGHWKSDPALEIVRGRGPTMETSINEGQELPGSKVASDPSGEMCYGIPGSFIHLLGLCAQAIAHPIIQTHTDGLQCPWANPSWSPMPLWYTGQGLRLLISVSGGSTAIKSHIARQEAKKHAERNFSLQNKLYQIARLS